MKTSILILIFSCFFCMVSFRAYSQIPTWTWAKNAIGNYHEEANCVKTDAEGNIYLTGNSYSSSLTFDTITLINHGSSGTWDIFLVKYDCYGSLKWAKGAGNPSNDVSNSMAIDANGFVYIAGYFESTSLTFGSSVLPHQGGRDLFIAKFDTNGNAVWARSAGGIKNDIATSITVDASGNVYLTGEFASSSISFGSDTLTNSNFGSDEVFVAKYDSDGNIQWCKSMGTRSDEDATSISVDNSNNVYITGYFESDTLKFGTTTMINKGWKDVFLCKFDSEGNKIWARNIGGDEDEESTSVIVDPLGNIYLAGWYKSSKIFSDSDTLYNSDNNFSTSDMFLLKYDPYGNIQWTKSFGGIDDDWLTSIASDLHGNIYLTGFFQCANLNFGSNTLTNSAIGVNDIFMAKYSSDGLNLWARNAGGAYSDCAYTISADKNDDAIIAGHFVSDSICFGSITLINPSLSSLFIAKFGNGYLGINELQDPILSTVFPNPATEMIKINSPINSVIDFIKLDGRLIKSVKAKDNQTNVNISDLASGLYILKILSGTRTANIKLIKQ